MRVGEIVLSACLVRLALTQLCTSDMKGDSACDRVCMTSVSDYDSSLPGMSDCVNECTSHCAVTDSCQAECVTWDCAWSHGLCGECAPGCLAAWVGDGLCHSVCNVQACSFDAGDCADPASPNEVYISSNNAPGDGTWSSPFPSLVSGLASLWLPYNTVYLLSGTHPLLSDTPVTLLTSKVLTQTTIKTLFCGSSSPDHLQCAADRATIQLSNQFLSFLISHYVVFESVVFKGDYSLVKDCTLPTCFYCPYVTLDTSTGVYRNDRNEIIDLNDYAEQSLCDYYADKAFLTVSGQLIIRNSLFTSFRQQLKALIWNKCGEITLSQVDFANNIPAFQGLDGGLIGQTCPNSKAPYYCGRLTYTDGVVRYMNQGYEYRSDIRTSGFLSADGLTLLYLERVLFEYNFLPVGHRVTTMASSMISLQRIRESEVRNCTFRYNVASLAVGVTIINAFQFPVILDASNTAVEHCLQHITLSDLFFYNNTADTGTVLYVQFRTDHQNILLTNCRFTNNFSTKGALISINNDQLLDRYQNGAFISLYLHGSTQQVWICPRFFTLTNSQFTANYANSLIHLSEVGNAILTDIKMTHNGNSVERITSLQYVFQAFVSLTDFYISSVSLSFPAEFFCENGLFLTNIMQINVQKITIEDAYCPKGSPGISLIGEKTTILAFQNLNFTGNTGSKLISLTINNPISLTNVTFRNNTNNYNANSACFYVFFTNPNEIILTNSSFVMNKGEDWTVGTVVNPKIFDFSGILMEKNEAKYSGAGILISPNETQKSILSVKNCVFQGNSANSKGVFTVLDFYGVLSNHFEALATILIDNCDFFDNFSNEEGAGITIYDSIQVDPASLVSNCRFRNNTSTGGGLFLTYQTGIITISACVFEKNTAIDAGAGIYANQDADSERNPTFVQVKWSVFRENTGPSVAVDGKTVQNTLKSEGNQYENNRDSAVIVRNGMYQDKESRYVGNKAEYGAGMYLKLYAAAEVEGSHFQGNEAAVDGGAVYSRFFCPAKFRNCTFSENVADSGGVIYADTSLNILFAQCMIRNNTARRSGSCMYNFAGSMLFEDTSVLQNTAGSYSLFVIVIAATEVRGCTISENVAADRTAGILMTSSELSISDTTFSNQTSKNGAFILSLNNNQITISGSVFHLGSALVDGGAIFVTLDSELSITNSRFYNCTAGLHGGAIYATKSATLVENVEFYNTSAIAGSAIDIDNGTGRMLHCRFENYSGSAVYVETSSSLEIVNASFIGGIGEMKQGAGVCALDVAIVNLTSSVFERNQATNGGAAYFYSTVMGAATDLYTVVGNRFESNSAASGGAIESNGVNLHLSNNTFQHNSATYVSGDLLTTNGVGGGAVLRCYNPSTCTIVVKSNVFKDNYASIDGGAVHWQESPPVFEGNEYEGNQAVYGANIASFAVALAPISSSFQRIPYQDDSLEVPVAYTLPNFVSGQLYTSTLRFGLFDHLSQLVSIANSSYIEMETVDNTTISGQFKESSSQGVFEMSKFTVIAEPGSTRIIHFATDAVDKERSGARNDSVRYVPTIAVKVNLRLCEPGETNSNSECVVCQAETFSLNPSEPCKTCLAAATCYGGFNMVPKSGYWRARNDTTEFFSCLNPSACTGSPPPPALSLTGLCADGYSGNLCQVCLPGFSRTGRNLCARCPGLTANVSISSLIILVALCGIALIVTLAIRSATKPRSLMAIYFKISLNYLQMVVVAASLNLNWPSFVKTFLSTQELAGGVADQLFSFECLMHNVSISDSVGGVFTAKMMMSALLPAALMLVCCAAWGLIRLVKKVDFLFEKLISSGVVILFIVHPSVTKVMFSVYSCMEILPGEYWVIADLAEQCWTATHWKVIFLVSVPSLALWVLGLPTVVLAVLIHGRLHLHDMSQRIMYSFLYKGYEQRWFYWEFVILYRKIGLVTASVFLSPVSVRTESLTILAILLVALYFQLRYQPYNEPTLNKLEVKSILVSAVTIYAGLYYDSRNMSKH